MGWASGSQNVIDTTPEDIRPLRAGVIDFLMGPNGFAGGPSGGISTPQAPPNPFRARWDASRARRTNAAGVPTGGTNTVQPSVDSSQLPSWLDPTAMAADPAGFQNWLSRAQNQGAPTSWAQPQTGGVQPRGENGQIGWGEDTIVTDYAPGPGAGGPGTGFWGTMPMLGPGGPSASQGLNRIFGQTSFAGFNPNVPYVGNSTPIMMGQTPDILNPDRSGIRDVNRPQGADDIWNFVATNLGLGGQGVDLGKGPQLGQGPQAGFQGTQSVDQLGSATSGFFKNMMSQYQPAFTQARADSLAQAKESMGNLTGSGAGNTLGAAVNRSLGQEQATLAELAKWGVGQELGRQLGLAGINANVDVANMGAQNQRDITGASLQNARDISGAQLGQQQLSSLLGTATNMMGQDINRQGMNQGADQAFMQLLNQIAMANQGTRLATNQQQGQMSLAQALQNQNLQQGAANQSSQQGTALSQFNAGQANALSAQNAQNFMNVLMGMLTNNNSAVQQNPSILGQILSAGATLGGAALACWVAEELYGEDDQRTHDARLYVLAVDSPFHRLYRKHGKRWAEQVKASPELRAAVKPIWDTMAENGRFLRRAA